MTPKPIELRRAVRDDADALASLMGEPEVYVQLLQMPYPDAEAWRKRLENRPEPGEVALHLVAVSDGVIVGSAGLHASKVPLPRRHCAALGICVAKSVQGTGVGDLLMRALLDYADRWAGLLRIELEVWEDNARAIRLYKKHGFELEGRMRAWGYRDGRYVNALSMARLNPAPAHL